jgi:hypothetical protein
MVKKLFYPCAGPDWKDAFRFFCEEVDEFVFCDLKYKFNPKNLNRFLIGNNEYEDISFTLRLPVRVVDHTSNFENVKLMPAEYTKFIKHKNSNKTKKIIFKMESAQNCLDHFNNEEIYVFFHRGDSPGEGGSDLHFFTNKRNYYGTAENLYSRLIKKLAPISFVASDGSNNDVIREQNLNLQDMTDEQIENEIIGKNFLHDNLEWTCVKRLNDKYGPTLVWRVIKK